MTDSEPLQARVVFGPRNGMLDVVFLPWPTDAQISSYEQYGDLQKWHVSLIRDSDRPAALGTTWWTRYLQAHDRQLISALLGPEILAVTTTAKRAYEATVTLSPESAVTVRAAWRAFAARVG